MDRITQSFFHEFIKDNEFEKEKEFTQFELFVNNCIISTESGISTFKLEETLTGDSTQGIDGIAIIVNNKIVNETAEIDELFDFNRRLDVKFIFIQAKNKENFQGQEILGFSHWTSEFFKDTALNYFSTEEMKKFYELKEYIYSESKFLKNSTLELKLFYVTIGKSQNIDENLISIKETCIRNLVETDLFSNVELNLIGSTDLQKMYRKIGEQSCATFNFEKKVVLKTSEKVDGAYYGALNFKEFKKILVDDMDRIKNIFDDNIRDFLGSSIGANEAMNATLNNPEEIMNFSILNNGVTIVAEKCSIIGEKFIIENYQIVNGCQTSHILYENRNLPGIDEVSIPIRIVVTKDEEVKNSITTATNNQTAVKTEHLIALTTFQRDLEQFYSTYITPDNDFKLYYERRVNQYSREPIPKNKIVTIQTQIKAFASMFLEIPHEVASVYGSIIKRKSEQIFSNDHKLIMYYVSALAFFKLDYYFKNGTLNKQYQRMKNHLLFLLKLEVFQGKNPQLNSREMEKFCNKILELINNQNLFLEKINNYIKFISESQDDKYKITDRKLFERKETTEYLKNKLQEFLNN